MLSLNPHAGDNGLLGKEEQEIIAPAITELRQKHHVLAFGPYAADGFFGSGAYENPNDERKEFFRTTKNQLKRNDSSELQSPVHSMLGDSE